MPTLSSTPSEILEAPLDFGGMSCAKIPLFDEAQNRAKIRTPSRARAVRQLARRSALMRRSSRRMSEFKPCGAQRTSNRLTFQTSRFARNLENRGIIFPLFAESALNNGESPLRGTNDPLRP